MPKRRIKHFLQHIPIEMLCEILSHLHVRDFAALAKASRWMHNIVYPLRLDYKILSIHKMMVPMPIFSASKKVFSLTDGSCTYAQLRKVLNSQIAHRSEWRRAISRVKYENEVNANPVEVATEAMKALAKVLCVTGVPMFAGALLDEAKVDVGYYVLGFSGFQVGYGLSMTLLSGFCAWMMKVVMDNKDDIDYQSVQLIVEDSVSLNLVGCLRR